MVLKFNQFIPDRKNLRKKQRVVKPVKPALTDIINYRKQLDAVLENAYQQVKNKIYPLLVDLEPQYVTDTPREDAIAELETIQLASQQQTDGIAKSVAIKTVNKVADTNKQRMQAIFNQAFGINFPQLINDTGLQHVLNDKIDQNIALIKTIPQEYLQRVKKSISAGIVNGNKAVDITKQLSNDYGISQRRARFIARDQVSKINAAVSQLRQKNLGVDKYQWTTAGDDRVREAHAEVDGNIYSYDEPPEETDFNNPGEDYGCRCVAAPVLEFD